MTERLRIQPRGREFLVTQGIPRELLGQMRTDGLMPDYFNYYVGTQAVLGEYNPRRSPNNLGDPDASQTIRTRLKAIPSYTEYWHNRVASRVDNPEATFALITNAYRGSSTLDFITSTMRKSADDPELTPADLIRHFVILASMAYRKLDSSPRALAVIKHIRQEFGVDPETPKK